ncbi:MAG: hypothetical protein WC543_06435 [Candidatus Omnitrophota bacterium]
MKKNILVLSCLVFSLCFGVNLVSAENKDVTTVTQKKNTQKNWKQKISADKQQIKMQKQEISKEAQAARAEEKQLREQIKAALAAGDQAKAQQLKEQLRALHQKNMQVLFKDKLGLLKSKKGLKKDLKQAHKDKLKAELNVVPVKNREVAVVE